MLQSEFRHFDDVLASIEFFERSKTTTALVDCIKTAAATYGYNHFVIAAAPTYLRHDFNQLVLLRHWPEQWFKEYVHESFHKADPIAAHARSQCNAFAWADTPPDLLIGKPARLMEVASRDHDMRQGLCVPIHGMHGYEAAISFAGPDVDCTKRANAAMELVAIYAMNSTDASAHGRKTTPAKIVSAREGGFDVGGYW